MAKGEKNVSMVEFITAFQKASSIREVAEALGLTEASVQTRASKYRHPEYKQVQKTVDGLPVYVRPDGTETTDKASAKRTTQGQPVKVMVNALGADGKPIVVRQKINLKQFPRGGGARLDAEAANKLIAELSGQAS